MTDLLARTAEFVDIPSLSLAEGEFVDHLEAAYRSIPGLTVERVGDNLVARTDLRRETRLLLVGHSDTVAPDGNERARIEGDRLWGIGSADMKGALAVMLTLAEQIQDPAVDVTHVVYAAEEIAAEHNGLAALIAERPDLVTGDVAIVGEPTSGQIEAGCQGSLRIRVTVSGAPAHSARPWMGTNAVHRLAPLLDAIAGYQERRPVIGGCEFREALQVVRVEGGVASNVVPPEAVMIVNHRHAPDRSSDDAFAAVRSLLEPLLGADDRVELEEAALAAAPATDHPLIAGLIRAHALEVTAKLGWTDVSRLTAHGIPAVNFGPGDATLAHHRDERVDRDELERVHRVLGDLLTGGPTPP